MAIRVRYWQNTSDCYSEGPFVMVNASGWRIEVEYKGQRCPALPDSSIYAFLKEKGLPDSKTDDEALCACLVDYLNAKVKDGSLTLDPKYKVTYVWELHEMMLKNQEWEKKRLKMLQDSIDL